MHKLLIMNKLRSRLVFLAILLFSQMPISLNGQTAKYWMNYYKDEVAKGIKILSANFNTSYEETAEGKFVAHEYHVDTKSVTAEYFFTAKDFKVKNGPCRRWSDAGKLMREGHYKDNKMDGKWANRILTQKPESRKRFPILKMAKKMGRPAPFTPTVRSRLSSSSKTANWTESGFFLKKMVLNQGARPGKMVNAQKCSRD